MQKINTQSIKIFSDKLPKYLHSAHMKIISQEDIILSKYLHTFVHGNKQNFQILMPRNLVKIAFTHVHNINIRFPHRLKKMSIVLFQQDVGINKTITFQGVTLQIPEYLDTLIIRGYKQGIIENLPNHILCLSIGYDVHFDINELYSIPNNLTHFEVGCDHDKILQPKYKGFTRQSNNLENNHFIGTDMYTRTNSVK